MNMIAPRHIVLLLFFASFGFHGSSQITADKTLIDFGLIERDTDRVVDITLKNNTSEEALYLRAGFPFDFGFLFSDRKIPAGEEATLRIKYNPRTMGKLKEDIEIFYNIQDEPIVLKFRGDVAYIDNSDNPSCPSFSDRPANCCNDQEMTLVVKDSQTLKPIPNANVKIIQNGWVSQDWRTDRKGSLSKELEVAYYYMAASHPDYNPNDTATYVNRKNDYFEILLDPRERYSEVIKEATIIINPQKKEPEKKEEKVVPPKTEELVIVDKSDVLPESQFKRNNIVFLVDISASMNQKGKMDLLKASMYELTFALRDIDQVSLITYASNAEILIEAEHGDQKNRINEQVELLQAGGMTSGAKGFKKAYQLAQEHFVKEGNNQLIVVTDGAFKSADGPVIRKLSKKMSRKVKTSILGIKANSVAQEKLSEISDVGKGNYIALENYDQTSAVLIQEIKDQSRRE